MKQLKENILSAIIIGMIAFMWAHLANMVEGYHNEAHSDYTNLQQQVIANHTDCLNRH
jgi:hypothetical protein